MTSEVGIMVELIFVFAFFVFSFVGCCLSFLYLDRRVKVKKLSNSDENNDVLTSLDTRMSGIKWVKEVLSVKTLIISFVFSILSLILGLIIFEHVTSLLNFWRIAFICVIAYGIAIIDFKLKIIPNLYVLILLFSGTVFHIVEFVQKLDAYDFSEILKSFFFNNVLLTIVVIIVLWLIALIMRGGMGYGDIKFLGALCYFSGIGSLIFSLSIALLVSLLFACVLLILKKKNMKDEIPFGPFMTIGIILCAFLGLL